MSHEKTLIRGSLIYFLISLILIVVACKPVEPSLTTQTTITHKENETITPTLEPTKINQTKTPLPSPTHSLLLTQTPTATMIPTLQATNLGLKKVTELPQNGSGLAVSNDGSLVAITNPDDIVIYVLDLETQGVIWKFEKNPNNTIGSVNLVFSPDSSLLVAGGLEQDVVVWDIKTGGVVLTIPSPFQNVSQLSFSLDGQLLAISSNEGLQIYNTNTGTIVDTLPSTNITIYPTSEDMEHPLDPSQATKWFVGSAVFVPNHANLLAITINNPYAEDISKIWTLYFWDMDSQELREILTGDAFGNTIIISPNGEFLLTQSGDNLHGWDIQNSKEISVKYPEELADVRLMALTNSGLLAALNKEGDVVIWNLGEESATKLESDKFITYVVFTPNDNLLIAGFSGQDVMPIEIWELNK